ncbi:3-oxoacyl-[acyl-carrier protein] reductase [Deinobacterium chartae]|uniref:3-oxoacyl-[acyl-carrier protein] reductase n=1 Tax=Deinobacterium chartae TaxID=521158 RepID=A0A841HV24_9DEIO|nr:SDR family oxidoreductase [Deinobacterium chartae]MBB6097331.1 3-oxoacyl-[acyl-carrier protein] reductase [Deinobacterium chartae]
MDLQLTGKRAIVTAASGGLGYASALELAREGAAVAICSRDAERAQGAAARITQQTGSAAYGFAADVADAASLEAFFAQAVAALGGLDILICNAGGPPAGGFLALEDDTWEAAFQLTLMSVVRSVRLALPHFTAAGGGRVLAITSSSVKRPIENLTLSNALRPAVQGLCKSLSIELAAQNVQVNGLAPGRVLTERIDALDAALAQRRGSSLEAVRRESESQIPMGRLGEPAEFGRVAAFLCSPAAAYINGSTLLVDGGAVTSL